MTSSATKRERRQALRARTRKAKRLLVIAGVCLGLGVLTAVAMAVVSLMTEVRAVAMLSGPVALLALIAFAVLTRREVVAPQKMNVNGRVGIIGVFVSAATMGTAQVLSWAGADGGASLAALLTLVPALLTLGSLGTWVLRGVNAEGVSTASSMNSIVNTDT